jgi:hypothetical protein
MLPAGVAEVVQSCAERGAAPFGSVNRPFAKAAGAQGIDSAAAVDFAGDVMRAFRARRTSGCWRLLIFRSFVHRWQAFSFHLRWRR